MIATIDVVRDAKSHPLWIVERFARMPAGAGLEWVPLPSSVSRLVPDAAAPNLPEIFAVPIEGSRITEKGSECPRDLSVPSDRNTEVHRRDGDWAPWQF